MMVMEVLKSQVFFGLWLTGMDLLVQRQARELAIKKPRPHFKCRARANIKFQG